jgi:hypothetical protein
MARRCRSRRAPQKIRGSLEMRGSMAHVEVLSDVEQMSVEFHGIGRPIMIEVFQKLRRIFYVVDVHFNNSSCADFFATGDILAPFLAYIFEVLLVNKRLGIPTNPPRPPPVNPLHVPNVARRGQCQVPWD